MSKDSPFGVLGKRMGELEAERIKMRLLGILAATMIKRCNKKAWIAKVLGIIYELIAEYADEPLIA